MSLKKKITLNLLKSNKFNEFTNIFHNNTQIILSENKFNFYNDSFFKEISLIKNINITGAWIDKTFLRPSEYNLITNSKIDLKKKFLIISKKRFIKIKELFFIKNSSFT